MAEDGADLRRLTSELRESPGFKVHSEMNNNKRSLRILSRNKDELMQSLADLKKQGVSGASMSASESPSLSLAIEELTRRLENYLSSAYDLIDYTRRYCRKLYEKTDYAREIQSEIDKRFIFEQDYKIASGLRSISAHVDSLEPPTILKVDDRQQDAPYRIEVKQLLAWDEWNDNQRRILEGMNGDIDIQEFVERYSRKIEAFYAWLWKRQSEIHAEELRQAEEIRLRAKEAYDKLFPAGT